MNRIALIAVIVAAVAPIAAAPAAGASDGAQAVVAKKKKKKVSFATARSVTTLNILNEQLNDPAVTDGAIEACVRISRLQVNCDAYILRGTSPVRIDWTQVVKTGSSYKVDVVATP